MMSLSWNFPDWAKSSWEGCKSSQAKLGHLNFQVETELTFGINKTQIFTTYFFFLFYTFIMIKTNCNYIINDQLISWFYVT